MAIAQNPMLAAVISSLS